MTVAWALAVAGLGGCGGEKGGNLESHLAAARSHLDRHEPRAAIIEAKNALQTAPDSPDARLLLARALLDNGEARAASVESRKAIELNADDSDALPLLARAMNASGQWKPLITEFSNARLTDATAAADLHTSLAAAHAAVGERDAARREIGIARLAVPAFAPARLFEARLAAESGDLPGALKLAESVSRDQPADDEAWLLVGHLQRQQGDAAAAITAYRQALTLRASSAVANAALISLLIEQKQYLPAQAQWVEMKKYWPQSVQTKWFEATLAFQRKDIATAARLAPQLVEAVPGDVRFLAFSAMVAQANGSSLQAESALAKALALAPDNAMLRRLLARSQLTQGQSVKALETIQPLSDKPGADAETLAIAAQALLLNGEADKAQELFVRAAALNPADTAVRTAVAVGKLARGEGDAGLAELRHIASADADGVADQQLISTLAQRGDVPAALAAVADFEKKRPGDARGPHLRGSLLKQQQDLAGARAAYERALVLDPRFTASAIALAMLDVADKKFLPAQQRLEKLVALEPKNTLAALALVDVQSAGGATPAQVTASLADIVKADPASIAPRLKQIEHALQAKDSAAALAAAQAGVQALPGNAQLLDAQASVLRLAGKPDEALGIYAKIAALMPQAAWPQMRIAEVHLAARASEPARAALKRALSLDPSLLAARRQLIALALGAHNNGEALELARSAQKLSPRDAAGFLFEGDVQALTRNWPAAITAYRQADALDDAGPAAIKLHAALRAANRNAEADAYASAHLAARPRDAAFVAHLGEAAIGRKDYATAERRFSDLVRLQPDAAAGFNNLAWVMLQLQRKGALVYAEKANALRPEQPPFVDTLTQALAADGQTDKALEMQRKLVDSRPAEPEFRLTLARLYVGAGQKSLARAELDRLAPQSAKLADPDEVRRLQKQL